MPNVVTTVKKDEKKSDIYQVYEVTCPLCEYEGRRNNHESDALNELAAHIGRQHDGYIHMRRYKRTVEWELIEDEANSE